MTDRIRSMNSSVRLRSAWVISFSTHLELSESFDMNRRKISDYSNSLNISGSVCRPASKEISSRVQFFFPKIFATRLTNSLSLLLWDRKTLAITEK